MKSQKYEAVWQQWGYNPHPPSGVHLHPDSSVWSDVDWRASRLFILCFQDPNCTSRHPRYRTKQL